MSTMPTFFATAKDFRAWLAAHSSQADELLVGFYKVGSGQPSMSWPQSVDEALCFGWIDGVRKRIDEEAYQIRFTPRRPGSIWSAININKVAELKNAGRMQAAGLQAYAHRVERKSRVYAYEQADAPGLAAEDIKTFRKNKTAWAYFEKQAPSYKRVMVYWVTSAKQTATRERRLAKLIETCAAGVRMLK